MTRGRARRSPRARDGNLPLEGLPLVAIVGRPNVGKSTLFNRIVGERTAIVEDRARTTRDRLYAPTDWNERRFLVVDTGGLERRPGDPIEEKVQEQARLAIAQADLILFVVDAAVGITPADLEADELLRTSRAPVLLVANKADNERRELEAAEFHQLGWDPILPVSALHGRGAADLLDGLVEALPPESEAERERKRAEAEAEVLAQQVEELGVPHVTDPDGPAGDEAISAIEQAWDARVAEEQIATVGPTRIAIVGRPNVGKSSLLNALLGEERAIVSEVPGTTRDALDTALEWNGRPIRLVDTAGVRRRGKVSSAPPAERFSVLRALRAVSRADVAVLVLDAVDGLTAQDAHVAGYVVEEGRGLLIALNKWDLVEKDEHTFEEYARRIRTEAPFLDFAPVVAISAKTGQRVGRILETAFEIAGERRHRVPTGELNRLLADATFRQAAPSVKGRRPKFFYGTQAAVAPPTFVVFASDAASVHFGYGRYLENQLRAAFGFDGTPIRILFRERRRAELDRPRRSSASRGGGARVGGRPQSPTRPVPRGARRSARPAR